MNFFYLVLLESWQMLLDSAVYILFGILVGGLLKVFLSPAYVLRHLGQGRFSSVFKAALFGIPLPLCSCGVLPAAAALKKQGASNGATTAFLISTPESGVDSISITYALLDPLMTVARPVAAFLTAVTAGLVENFITPPRVQPPMTSTAASRMDDCCGSTNDKQVEPAHHYTWSEKLSQGVRYAVQDLWGDLAKWFFAGLLLGGIITALLPEELIAGYLGGGLSALLLMLVLGIPIYICATASTPIAAALILKGVSPGAALVFLLVGPATNMASLSVLTGLLGKKATLRYLGILSAAAVACGLLLDAIYQYFQIPVRAVLGQAGEVVPFWLQLLGVLVLVAISIPPLYRFLRVWRPFKEKSGSAQNCGCNGGCRKDSPPQFLG